MSTPPQDTPQPENAPVPGFLPNQPANPARPLSDFSPEELRAMAAEGQPAADGGMSAREPEYDAPPAESARPEDAEALYGGGMSAYEPILRADELPEAPGAPLAPMQLPPPEARVGMPPFSPTAYEDPSPIAALAGSLAPQQNAPQAATPEMTTYFVTDERLNTLWQRADNLLPQVREKVHTLQIARQLLDQIQAGRNEIMAGRDHYEEAERFFNEAEYRIGLTELLKRWSFTWGLGLFFYELLWVLGLGAVIFVWLGAPVFSSTASDMQYILAAMIWGGIGGVTGAWLALVKHIAREQDFDIQHTIWYLTCPPIGLIIGLFVYLILQAGLISLTGASNIQSPMIIYVLAWLAGYQQNVFTELVKRVLKVFEIGLTTNEKK